MWHLWDVDLRFALNSTPGWVAARVLQDVESAVLVEVHDVSVEVHTGRINDYRI